MLSIGAKVLDLQRYAGTKDDAGVQFGQPTWGATEQICGKITRNKTLNIFTESEGLAVGHILHVENSFSVALQDRVFIDGSWCEIVQNFGNNKYGIR